MDKSNNINVFLTDLGNTIREVSGSSDPINPQDFSSKIRELVNIQIPLNIKSTAFVSGKDLDNLISKQKHLMTAVNDTKINNESVYKMDQRQNQDSFDRYDTLFYTKEGDLNGYYYLYNPSDNYVSREQIKYDVKDNNNISDLITILNAICKNDIKMKSISKVNANSFSITFEDDSKLTIDRISS